MILTVPRRPRWEAVLLVAVTVALLAGGVLWLTGRRPAADLLWAGCTVVGLVPAVAWVLRSLWHRQVGVDLIAVLALAGALVVGEYLAGAVVTLMLASGRTLEAYAEGRATRDLHTLLERAPRSVRRRTGQGVEVVGVEAVVADDRLLVSPGEVVPVDGRLEDAASLDESVVTGESQVVNRKAGEPVASGVVNTGPAFRATATAERSTYAGIVRIAQEATRRRAPLVRLADRYAALFTPFTVALAGLGWLVSGQLVRAVAVLVLATPVAIVSGLSRAARCGVVVRDGGSLETLGPARTLLVDKTGTLTLGRPVTAGVVTAPGAERDEVLRLAASVEQLSQHVLAGRGRAGSDRPGAGPADPDRRDRAAGHRSHRAGRRSAGPGGAARGGRHPTGPSGSGSGPSGRAPRPSGSASTTYRPAPC
jgi:cation transport ATPase